MPDFMPLIRANLPAVLLTLLFVGVVQLVAFLVQRWKKIS